MRARVVARIAAPMIGALPPVRTLGAAVAVLAVVASIGWGSRTPASFDSQTTPSPRMARCMDSLEGPAPFAVCGGCPGAGEERFLSAGEGSSGAIGSSSG